MSLSFQLNGEKVETQADTETPVLWVLRDEFKLTGTKYGCGMAQCGACTVFVDGAPRRSCVTPVSSVEGSEIVTIEGLDGNVAEAVQSEWKSLDVPQCGYCQSGQIMSAIALLEMNAEPTDEDIDNAMAGNVCRCATYFRIRKAIKQAAKKVG